MAIEVAVEPGAVTVHLRGWDWVLAARCRLVIPAERIAGVTIAPRTEVHRPGVSLTNTGTYLPGLLYYGRFGMGPAREFWAVRCQERLVVIECRDWDYVRVVLGVPDPEVVAGTVRLVAGAR